MIPESKITENENYVFISYSRVDYVDGSGVPMADSPVTRLMAFLDDSGIPYWIDKKGIYPGDKYIKLISEAICNSSMMLFVSSAASNQSEWTLREVCLAQEKGKLIIPIRIDDTPFNSSISLLVSTLDRIDYYAFQEKSFDSLLKAIQIELNKFSKVTEPDNTAPANDASTDSKDEGTGEEVKDGRQKDEGVIVEDNLMDRFPELKLKPSCFLRVFKGSEDDPKKAYRNRVRCYTAILGLLYISTVLILFENNGDEYLLNLLVALLIVLFFIFTPSIALVIHWVQLRRNLVLSKFTDYCQLNEKGYVIETPYLLVAKGSKFGIWNHKKSSFQIRPEYDYLEWREYGKLLKATKDGKVFTIDIYGRKLM